VDETVTYTLRATNVCGGSETRTATLHIVGSIESVVNASALETKFDAKSIYFPFDLPGKAHPQGGLLPGEQDRLKDLPSFLLQYLEYQPQAHLILEGHADQRGGLKYNDLLSQRRADSVKRYLVEQNVPAANIETQAFGKRQDLTTKEVLELNDQNPNLTPQERKRIALNIATFRMANNRRVDIKLGAAGKESYRYFPYNSDEEKLLLSERKHGAKQSAKEKAPEKK
jgi:outer membrane protein OmpA-like peptidoglycan-associated protein